jgi:hypothetical protein
MAHTDPRVRADAPVTFSVPRERLLALRCRFPTCPSAPVGIVHAPHGCFCWDDPVQALCAQHAVTAHPPHGGQPIECLLDFRLEQP